MKKSKLKKRFKKMLTVASIITVLGLVFILVWILGVEWAMPLGVTLIGVGVTIFIIGIVSFFVIKFFQKGFGLDDDDITNSLK